MCPRVGSVLLAMTLVLTMACGSSPSDPVLRVGAYTVPVPSGWQNVSSQDAPGKVAIQTVQRTPPVLIIFSPAPDPMPFDPTDAGACEANGGRMPGIVGRPAVVELPAGKACRVETNRDGKLSIVAVLASGSQGLMATCLYGKDADASMCDGMFKRVKKV